MKTRFLPGAAAFAAALALTAAGAFAYQGQQYASHAKVSIVKARAIALKAVRGGKIVDEELERESGGSGLRYSFDVQIKGKVHEVGVDARTGRLLENSVEGNNSD